jgi:hypothetical protein
MRTRLAASQVNATRRPSALIDGSKLSPSAWRWSAAMLIRVVWPVWRSCTKTSWPNSGFLLPLLSRGTRLLARDRKAT